MAGVGVLLLLIFYGVCFPDRSGVVLPYRFYYVLTNSMEPTVATNSLVLVQRFEDQTPIKKGDIIVFRADRFGERVIMMHRFSHTERNSAGELVYRTHPEGSETLDVYETKQEDILGVYRWHVPYVGKLILFFRSEFGLFWLCQIIVILLIKALVTARWKETAAA